MRNISFIRKLSPLFIIISLLGALLPPGSGEAAEPVSPAYTVKLGGGQIRHSSPTVADINEDGRLEIIIGTTAANGSTSYTSPTKLSVVSSTGAIIWEVTTRAPVNSTPAVADIDGDGHLDIVIGVGGTAEDPHHNGGVFAFNRFGAELWHVDTMDISENHDGFSDGVFTSPAIGDINNDGIQEVVFGAWDQRAYAVRGTDGGILPGWPVDLWDTIWSSPALADMNRDGFLDIIIGADLAGNNLIIPPTQDGGRLHVLKYDGTELPGFPIYQDQVFWSSPVVADIDEDGWPDIVVGTGHYWPGKGYRIYAYRHDGTSVPGWPVATGAYMFASPVVADINEDGHLEVISVGEDGKVYVFNRFGSPLWTTTMYDQWGKTGSSGSILQTSLAVADINGDNHLEILVGFYWEIVVLDRNGIQLTSRDRRTLPGPTYQANYTLVNTPTVADIDNDGQLEMIAAGSHVNDPAWGYVYIWKLGSAASRPPWPMFRLNARHTASFLGPSLQTTAITSVFYMRPGSGTRSEVLGIFDGSGGVISWTATSNQSWLKLSQVSGLTPSKITVTIDSNVPVGVYSGQLVVSSPGLPTKTISVTLVASLSSATIYLPNIERHDAGGFFAGG